MACFASCSRAAPGSCISSLDYVSRDHGGGIGFLQICEGISFHLSDARGPWEGDVILRVLWLGKERDHWGFFRSIVEVATELTPGIIEAREQKLFN